MQLSLSFFVVSKAVNSERVRCDEEEAAGETRKMAASGEPGNANRWASLIFMLLFARAVKGKEAARGSRGACYYLTSTRTFTHFLSSLCSPPPLAFPSDKQRSTLLFFSFLLLKWTRWHLGSLRAHKEVEEKLFLIVINIQKKQTICFQITGVPSLSFLHNVCTWRISEGTFWQTSEVALTPAEEFHTIGTRRESFKKMNEWLHLKEVKTR